MITTRRTRMLVMVLLLIAALVMAVAPALAEPNISPSFENDNNNDGKPDYWIVRGDVLQVCNHPVKAYDGDCMMVFPPSESRAALFLYTEMIGEPAEEATGTLYVYSFGAARHLQAGRAFLGVRATYDGYPDMVAYTAFDGGSYDWEYFDLAGVRQLPDVVPDSIAGGYLVLPHTGTLAVDLFGGTLNITGLP